MNYHEFVGTVTEFLRESLPCGTKLEMLPLEKNNGVIMDRFYASFRLVF